MLKLLIEFVNIGESNRELLDKSEFQSFYYLIKMNFYEQFIDFLNLDQVINPNL